MFSIIANWRRPWGEKYQIFKKWLPYCSTAKTIENVSDDAIVELLMQQKIKIHRMGASE